MGLQEGHRSRKSLPSRKRGPRPPARVTALIVALKPGNAGGAKGCRKMETR
jgi:hypothetical protein